MVSSDGLLMVFHAYVSSLEHFMTLLLLIVIRTLPRIYKHFRFVDEF